MADFRRSATEVKRDHDHKAKWAHGARQYNNKQTEQIVWDKWTIDSAGPVRLRPAPASSSATQIALKRYNESGLRSARHAVNVRLHHDVKEALTSDSSSDETVVHESYAPEGGVIADEAISAYAFTGNTVLSSAISKAEVKYENKVTEKLAKEYEFVSNEDDSSIGYVADVDDFEIIDHVAV